LIENHKLSRIREFMQNSHPELMLLSFTNEESRKKLLEFTKNKFLSEDFSEDEIEESVQELVGMGIIEDIVRLKGVTDISFNGKNLIVNTNDNKYTLDDEKIDETYIERLIGKLASATGKELTTINPILDTAFRNLRVNAVHRSVSPFGTTLALRFSESKLALNYQNFSDFAPPNVLNLLEAMVKTRGNIVISGETGSGKTELQKFLTGFIPFEEKIVLIEDTADSRLKEIYPEKDINSWISSEIVSFTDLIKAALRNNPTWIILSETRGKEAYEMLQAVLSGHKMITTLHAVDVRAIPKRFVNMIKIGYSVDESSVLDDIYSYFQFGIHVERMEVNGKVRRYLSEIVEYMSDGSARTIFSADRTGKLFRYKTHDLSEEFKEKIAKYGVNLDWGELHEEKAL